MLLMNSGSCFVVVRGFVALCETVLQHASKLSQSERASRSLAETGFCLGSVDPKSAAQASQTVTFAEKLIV